MNEHFVTSREWSERLKAAGVEQKSEHYWIRPTNSDYSPKKGKQSVVISTKELCIDESCRHNPISAFLASELFDYVYQNIKKDFWIYHNAGLYIVQSGQHDQTWEGDTLPNALAAMVCYLKERKMI